MDISPKFSIPPENFTSLVVSALGDINAKLLVLSEIAMINYSHAHQKTKEETHEFFDELLRKAQAESMAQYYSKYGGSPTK